MSPPDETNSHGPRLSIIVPVYREAEIINPLLDHLRGLESMFLAEIVIVDGDAGSTLEHIHPHLCTVLRSTVSPAGRAGQMNLGAAMARAPNLLFLHADARLPPRAIEKILFLLDQGKTGAGAFDLEIDSRNPALRLISKVANLRTRVTRIPYGDQAIFITREVFRAVGGFQDLPLMEDLELMHRIKRHGWSVLLLADKVTVSPRRWEKEGIVYCTIRNWLLLILYHLRIPARLYASLYPRPG